MNNLPVYSEIIKTVQSKGEYKYHSFPIPLYPFPTWSCAHDGVDNAYPAAKLGALHAVAQARGEQRHPVRVHLNRYDWDLIHNWVCIQFDKISEDTELKDALYRLIVKAHLEREWLNKIFNVEQTQMELPKKTYETL